MYFYIYDLPSNLMFPTFYGHKLGAHRCSNYEATCITFMRSFLLALTLFYAQTVLNRSLTLFTWCLTITDTNMTHHRRHQHDSPSQTPA